MWNSGSRPSYSAIRMKLGEVIVSATPRPAPKALARCVLPAPRSPHRQITSPGPATRRQRAAKGGRGGGIGQTSWRSRSVAAGIGPSVAEGVPVRPSDARRSARGRPAGPRRSSRRAAGPSPASSWTPPVNRRWPIASMNRPSRPASDPARIRTRSSGGVGDDEVRAGRTRASAGRSRSRPRDRPVRRGRPGPRPASGRRTAPSRTSTANDGSRWRAARWRASDARKSRRSLLDRPATTIPRDAHRARPGQRLRIDPRADHQDRAGRSDVEAARSQLALGTGLEPPAGRRPEGHDPADAATGRPDRDPDAGPDLAHDPGERRLERVGRCRPARPASGRATGRRTRHRTRPRRRAAVARSSDHRVAGRPPAGRAPRGAGRGAARRSAPRRRPNRRPTRAAGHRARGRTRRRPAQPRVDAPARGGRPRRSSPPARPRPTSATTRGARRAGRPGRAAAAARRAGRRRARRARPSRRSRNAGRACRAGPGRGT